MYTIGVYAVCVSLTFLIGAIFFAGCATLLIVKDVCLVLVDMSSRVLVSVRSSAMQALAVRSLPRLKGSYRREWATGITNHAVSPPRGLIRTR
jgi:hypothetical protein